MSRYARKRDRNEPAIIEKLAEYGCEVLRMEPPGVDLYVWWIKPRLGFWLEIKGANKYERGQHQQRMRDMHKASGFPYFVIREGESVANLLDRVRAHHAQPAAPTGRRRGR